MYVFHDKLSQEIEELFMMSLHLIFNNGTQVPSVSAKIKFDQNNEERGGKKNPPIMYDGNGMSKILAFCTLIIIAID
jgi:hypothetical protein